MLSRVGINALYLVPGEVGGTETYAVELLRSLAAARSTCDFIAFCGREAAPNLRNRGFPTNVRIVELPVKCRNKPARVMAEQFLLPQYARRAKVQLLHSMGGTTPLRSGFTRVVTIHDLIFHHFPSTFPKPAQKGLKILVPAGARRADRVIADSQATRRDLIDLYGLPSAKIDVVYLGSGLSEPASVTDEAELRARFALGDRPVVLTVAAALAHKNIDRLFAAMATLASRGLRPALVMAGHPGLELKRLTALAEQLGVGDQVHMTGWLEDADLAGFYRAAACFVFPSLYEGFGIPVLEAMKRGAPVASSNAASLPEVVGDAALTFDPLDEFAIADAIERLLRDSELCDSLRLAGYDRARRFTWEAAAEDTWNSYLAATGAAATKPDEH